jgi:hypothetical protein
MKRILAAVLLALITATLLTAAEAARPLVLITNGDGTEAPGFVALDQTDYQGLPALMVIPSYLMGAGAEPTRER